METVRIQSDKTAAVRFFGRTADWQGVVLFPWTGSGFTVRFRGTALSARLLANNTHNPAARPYLSVFVDDAPRYTVGLESPENTVVLAENLPEGEHTVTVVKLSEALQSWAALAELVADGALLAPPASEYTRRIQFIGDSITTGFGVLAPAEQDPFTTAEQDGWQSYAAALARELHAEYHIFAISGYAVYQSPFGKPIPPLYDFVDGAGECGLPWDHSRFQPDITVVNLGTNDHAWYCNDCSQHLSEEERHRRVEDAFYEFLKQLHQTHPYSKFLCTIGMLTAFTNVDVEKAVARAAAEGIEARFVQLPLAAEYGAGHPALSSHKQATHILLPAIREWMNWN